MVQPLDTIRKRVYDYFFVFCPFLVKLNKYRRIEDRLSRKTTRIVVVIIIRRRKEDRKNKTDSS
jgi:hypothetical protein